MLKQSLVAGLVAGLIVMQASAAPTPRFKPGELVFSQGVPEEFVSKVKKFHRLSGLTVVNVPVGQEIAAIKRAKSEGFNAELNYIATATGLGELGDTYSSYQWNMTQMGVPALWNTSTGAGIKVAVIDTGLSSTSGGDGVNVCPEPGYDFAYGDNDPDDRNGHGTHVSGTIAQNTGNGIGVVGLAPEACIIPVKALDDRGSGDFASIAEAIAYSVAAGAKVINMSLGAHGVTTSFMDVALNDAERAGVVVVAASGNDGDLDLISYPAIHPTVLSVGAVGATKTRAPYSNGSSDLDVVAPGGDTRIDSDGDGYVDGILQETFSRRTWSYYFYQGTSMASPHVAALAALMLEKGSLDPATVRARIRNSADDQGETGRDDLYGYGLINPLKALADTSTGSGGGTPTNRAPTASFTSDCISLTCKFTSTSSDPDGDPLTYSWAFGDTVTGTESSPSYTYTAAGNFDVKLTVTDTGGLTDTLTQTITVVDGTPPATNITLTASGTKTKGVMSATLTWEPSLTVVDVFRDNVKKASGQGGGTYTESLGKGGGTFTYYVCPTGNTLSTAENGCSNAFAVSF